MTSGREGHAVRQLIGVTGQFAAVDENLTARENLWMFGRLQGLSSSKAHSTGDDLLAKFDLTEAASRPISQFSGGMRRRLDLAASLMTRPALIFLDEPTTGLDPPDSRPDVGHDPRPDRGWIHDLVDDPDPHGIVLRFPVASGLCR
jgi:ABC-type multidrug transport system ATPase subunit